MLSLKQPLWILVNLTAQVLEYLGQTAGDVCSNVYTLLSEKNVHKLYLYLIRQYPQKGIFVPYLPLKVS